MYTLYSPFEVILPSGRMFRLNLNVYRNAHYRVLHQAKLAFNDLLWSTVNPLPAMEKCRLEYVLHPGTKRKMDIANVGSVVDKFFCDLLVQAGKLPDDNHEHVEAIS